jgi:hypothetical protein
MVPYMLAGIEEILVLMPELRPPELQTPLFLRESTTPPRNTLAGAVTCATMWQVFP